MKLYSSAFISIILAFLMFMGSSFQPVSPEDDFKPMFQTIQRGIESIGTTDRIRIEVFENLLCPDCSAFVRETLPKIRALETETDDIDLHLYFIPDIQQEAYLNAALSLKCAADQGGFWAMHDAVHQAEEALTQKTLLLMAKELGLNDKAMKDCLTEAVHQKATEEDIAYASQKNITFLPTILINEYRMIGNQPFENIQKIVNDFMKKKKKTASEITEEATDLQLELETFDT